MADEKINEDEHWMQTKWRPAMGWMYMIVCTTDFVIFPILWSLLQALTHGSVSSQWQPITLQGAGLFHVAMGAVLGIAAFGRTQEKVSGMANSNQNAALPVSTPMQFQPSPAPVQFQTQDFVSPPPVQNTQVSYGFGGKPAPAPAAQPLL
jgi:hypothetical protein